MTVDGLARAWLVSAGVLAEDGLPLGGLHLPAVLVDKGESLCLAHLVGVAERMAA